MFTFKEALKLNINSGKDETAKNNKFVNDFLNSGYRSPFDNRMAVYNIKGTLIQLMMKPARTNVYVASITVVDGDLGTGAGTELIKRLTKAADRDNITLKLVARPLTTPNGKSIPKNKLISWYKKFGFKADRPGSSFDNMTRVPL